MPCAFQVRYSGDEHAGTSAGWIVYGLAGFRLQHFGHQVDNGTVRIELLRRVAAVVCEFLDQVLVSLTELVLRAVGNGQRFRAEVLQQVFQKPVGEAILIGPSSITEDALQLIGVRIFNLPERLNDCYADIFRNGADVIPVIALRNDEGVDLVLAELGCIITVLFDMARAVSSSYTSQMRLKEEQAGKCTACRHRHQCWF